MGHVRCKRLRRSTARSLALKTALDVYPIKDYGAIETGTHRFCHTDEEEEICGTFKFLHIWQKEGTAWNSHARCELRTLKGRRADQIMNA